MRILPYQVNNVLRTYNKSLKLEKLTRATRVQKQDKNPREDQDKVTISAGAKSKHEVSKNKPKEPDLIDSHK